MWESGLLRSQCCWCNMWWQYEFGIKSCFHENLAVILTRVFLRLILQFVCSYITFPLYSLVTQVSKSSSSPIKIKNPSFLANSNAYHPFFNRWVLTWRKQCCLLTHRILTSRSSVAPLMISTSQENTTTKSQLMKQQHKVLPFLCKGLMHAWPFSLYEPRNACIVNNIKPNLLLLLLLLLVSRIKRKNEMPLLHFQGS